MNTLRRQRRAEVTCQLDLLIERWQERRKERGELLSPFSSAEDWGASENYKTLRI